MLRQKIQHQITSQIPGDSGEIAAALIVGNTSKISDLTLNEIRNSGLAHLLSISGLHMSLASAIFFFCLRFLLSRSEFLTLNYDIRKFSAFIAITAAYFYLQLAGAPIPAVRAFVMITLILIAIIFDRKTESLRCLAIAGFVILLINPYSLFSISFQLSFTAIFTMICFHQTIDKIRKRFFSNQKLFSKILWYLCEIFFISIAIQLFTLPFLIYHFGNIANYSPLANLAAIPLTSFIIMPLGFMSLLLMPFHLDFIPLYFMGISIDQLLKISHIVAGLNHSTLTFPQLSSIAFALSIIAIILISLTTKYLRLAGILLFTAAITSSFFTTKPHLLFDAEQKFFAIYDKNDGLIFSKKLRQSKKRDLWMRKMAETKFQYLQQFDQAWLDDRGISCDEKKCEITTTHKFLILLERNKISDICQNEFDIIINLSGKYQLPDCIKPNSKIIDNFDFLAATKKNGVIIF